MASAKGRVLTAVSGSIENGSEHWGVVRNGHQHIACRRSVLSFNPTDAQKISCVKFANSTRIAHKLNDFFKIPWLFKSMSEWPAETDPTRQTYNTWKTVIFNGPGNWLDSNGNTVGGIDFISFYNAFKSQPKDENGSIAIPTFTGYVMKKMVPLMTQDCKDKLVQYFGLSLFDETPEGYDQMKNTAVADSWLLPSE